jgi:hypothetical protein
VFIRVLAVLFTLGLLVSSAQAYDHGSVPEPSAPVLVDHVDDGQDEVDIALVPILPVEQSRSAPALAAPDAPPHYRHCAFVFRPPRSYAFN